MKLRRHYIRPYVAVVLLTMILALAACGDDPETHTITAPTTSVGDGALVVGLTTEAEMTVNSVQLFVFDHGSATLVSHSSFAHAGDAALHIQSLSPDTYTIIAAINATPWASPESTLSEVADALKREADINPQVRSGITMIEITAGKLTRVTIPLSQGVSSIGTATVRIRFSSVPKMPYEYTPDDTHSARNDATPFRCIAELRAHQTTTVAAHITTTAQPLPDGTYEMEVTAAKGSYDILIWLEAESEQSQFVTERLDRVTVAQVDDLKPMPPSRGGSASIYHLTVDNDTTITVDTKTVTSIYRIVATELDVYREYSNTDPDRFPTLNQIRVAVEYIDPYPWSLDIHSSSVDLSDPDYARVHTVDLTGSTDTEAMIFQSEMLSTIPGSTTIQLTVSDAVTGRQIQSLKKIPVNYTPGGITTIYVNPMIQTINFSGITIDTDWEDVIIHF